MKECNFHLSKLISQGSAKAVVRWDEKIMPSFDFRLSAKNYRKLLKIGYCLSGILLWDIVYNLADKQVSPKWKSWPCLPCCPSVSYWQLINTSCQLKPTTYSSDRSRAPHTGRESDSRVLICTLQARSRIQAGVGYGYGSYMWVSSNVFVHCENKQNTITGTHWLMIFE